MTPKWTPDWILAGELLCAVVALALWVVVAWAAAAWKEVGAASVGSRPKPHHLASGRKVARP